jgi:hypothetical protein
VEWELGAESSALPRTELVFCTLFLTTTAPTNSVGEGGFPPDLPTTGALCPLQMGRGHAPVYSGCLSMELGKIGIPLGPALWRPYTLLDRYLSMLPAVFEVENITPRIRAGYVASTLWNRGYHAWWSGGHVDQVSRNIKSFTTSGGYPNYP